MLTIWNGLIQALLFSKSHDSVKLGLALLDDETDVYRWWASHDLYEESVIPPWPRSNVIETPVIICQLINRYIHFDRIDTEICYEHLVAKFELLNKK